MAKTKSGYRRNKGYNWRKAAAIASGATLGYIAGNVKGAIAGGTYAGRFVDWQSKRSAARAVAAAKASEVLARKRAKRPKRMPRTVRAAPISKHNDMTVHNLGKTVVPYSGPKFGKVLGRYMYRNMNQWVVQRINSTVGQGLQAYDWPEAILSLHALRSDPSIQYADVSSSRSERVKLADDLYELNPYVTRPSTSLFGAPPVRDPESRIAIKGVVSEVSLLSMTTVAQHCDVYWITPKFDTDHDPNTTWENAIDALKIGQGFSTSASIINQTTAQAGSASADNWGENPFKLREFRKTWRCIKKSSVVLQPGDQRHLKLYIKYNKVFNRRTFYESRADRVYIGNTTVIPFIIARAGLIGLKREGDAEASEVAYGAPKVGVVHNSQIHMVALPANQYSWSRVYKGLVEGTSEIKQEIDDEDNVVPVETN